MTGSRGGRMVLVAAVVLLAAGCSAGSEVVAADGPSSGPRPIEKPAVPCSTGSPVQVPTDMAEEVGRAVKAFGSEPDLAGIAIEGTLVAADHYTKPNGEVGGMILAFDLTRPMSFDPHRGVQDTAGSDREGFPAGYEDGFPVRRPLVEGDRALYTDVLSVQALITSDGEVREVIGFGEHEFCPAS